MYYNKRLGEEEEEEEEEDELMDCSSSSVHEIQLVSKAK